MIARPSTCSAPACVALLLTVGFAAASCSAEDAGPPAAAPAGESEREGADASPAAEAEPVGKVHACAGAGRWFPAEADRLQKAVDTYLSVEAPVIGKRPVALIVPHAGYRFSGPCAGYAYGTLKGHAYDRVILIGLSHTRPLRKASVLRVDAYETPLGRISVDAQARRALLACPVVTEQPACHKVEWSCENQLPFLQRVLGDFKMVELLVGDLTGDERATLAEVVRGLIGEKTLVVVSSDFTHFGPNYGYMPFTENVRQNLKRLNALAVHRICRIDPRGWDKHLARTGATICGKAGIGLLLETVQPWEDVRATRAAMAMSGEITGDWANSVTYTSIVLWRAGEGLTDAEQQTLLRLARKAVVHYLKTKERLEVDPEAAGLTPALRAPGAVFVTLKNAGRLRGCIGHLQAVGPLYESVVANACNACEDQRFRDNPITRDEVKDLTIEISVLSPSRRVQSLSEVVVGRDGLVMARGGRRGVFLPQVPVEQGWDRGEYLVNLCGKAGLPPDAWNDPQTELYRFTAKVFHEGEGEPE